MIFSWDSTMARTRSTNSGEGGWPSRGLMVSRAALIPADAGSSVVTLLGFKLAAQAPDREHPFGHGRAEYVQRVDGLPGGVDPGPQDEQRHHRAAPSVDLQADAAERQLSEDLGCRATIHMDPVVTDDGLHGLFFSCSQMVLIIHIPSPPPPRRRRLDGPVKELTGERGTYRSRAVILATGVSRAAPLKGEAELLGRGVSYCATCDGIRIS